MAPLETPTTEKEPQTQEKALQRMAAGVQFNLNLDTLEKAREFCAIVSKTEMIPRAYANKPDAILVAATHGREIGLPFFAALQSIASINGVPSVYGDAALAIVRSSRLLEDFDEFFECDGQRLEHSINWEEMYKQGKNVEAVCMSKRMGMSRPRVTRFGITDAIRAKLWNKKTVKYKASGESYEVDSPWVSSPARMLMFRARGFNLRDNFGDLLKGLHMAEEMADLDMEADSEGTYTMPAEPPPKPSLGDTLKAATSKATFPTTVQTTPTQAPVPSSDSEAQDTTPEPSVSEDQMAEAAGIAEELMMTAKGKAMLAAVKKDLKLSPDEVPSDQPRFMAYLNGLRTAFNKLKG